jgi:hypothetical protein
MRLRFTLWTLALTLTCHGAPAVAQFPIERLDEGGYVVMLRHALAPGVGDRANFRLDACATQRNLSEEAAAGVDRGPGYDRKMGAPAPLGFPMTPELEAARGAGALPIALASITPM